MYETVILCHFDVFFFNRRSVDGYFLSKRVASPRECEPSASSANTSSLWLTHTHIHAHRVIVFGSSGLRHCLLLLRDIQLLLVLTGPSLLRPLLLFISNPMPWPRLCVFYNFSTTCSVLLFFVVGRFAKSHAEERWTKWWWKTTTTDQPTDQPTNQTTIQTNKYCTHNRFKRPKPLW